MSAGVGFFLLLALLAPSLGFALPTAEPAGDQTRAIARDQSNRVHTLWVEQAGNHHYRLLYQVYGLSGEPMAPAVVVRESRDRIRRPHLVVEGDQTAHLLWQERFSKVGGSKSPEGTWVHYARLAQSSNPVARLHHAILNERPLAQHPDLVVEQGAAYVVWEEGADTLVLARVAGTKHPIEYHRLASTFNAGRSFPSIAVDKDTLHLAWTATAPGNRQEIVHAMVSLDDFGGGLHSAEAVYSLAASAVVASQPKQIRVASNGKVTISWKNLREEGPIGWLAADHSQRITFSPGEHRDLSRQVALRDVALTNLPTAAPVSMPAVTSGKPSLSRPSAFEIAQFVQPTDVVRSTLERFGESIIKLRRARLLAFTSWSSAPPSRGEVTVFLFPPDVSVIPHLPAIELHTLHDEARFEGLNGMVSLG